MRSTIWTSIVTLLTFVSFSASALQETGIPAPDQAWSVGYTSFAARGESGLVWYPTRQVQGEKAVRFFNRPVVPKYPVIPDARFEPGKKVPLVVFSHGILGVESNYGWLTHALARAGFVVIAPRHRGQSARDMAESELFEFWERPQTVSRVVDWVLDDSPYKDQIEKSRIHFIGHSVGGHTGFLLAGGRYDIDLLLQDAGRNEAANRLAIRMRKQFEELNPDRAVLDKNGGDYSDRRFATIAVLDPTPVFPGFTEKSIRKIQTPFLYIGASRSEIFDSDYVKAEMQRINPAMRFHETGAGHFVFADEGNWFGRLIAPEVFVDHDSVDRRDVHRKLYSSLIKFME